MKLPGAPAKMPTVFLDCPKTLLLPDEVFQLFKGRFSRFPY